LVKTLEIEAIHIKVDESRPKYYKCIKKKEIACQLNPKFTMFEEELIGYVLLILHGPHRKRKK
jgi:hypothetical protein